MTPRVQFSIGSVTRFYIPLLMQAFSQSLTYPLVAGIVTHGKFGVSELSAFSQGQMVMFLIGAFGGGLVTTGMVFARMWYGYVSFKRLNVLMMTVLLAVQCLPVIHPIDRWVFEGVFALPPELADISRWTLFGGVVMNMLFFLRNVPMVLLFNNYESGKANMATIIRIVVTLLCSSLFPRLGLVGSYWGLLALTLGVAVELAVTWHYARPFETDLRKTMLNHDTMPARQLLSLTLEQFKFTLPLSFGGLLLMFSPILIAAFVGRSENAADMLAIHYVTIGVANPVAYAALRMQAVSIQFPPEYRGDRRLLVYAVIAGAVLGLVPLVFSTPLVGNWYFSVYQNVPAHILDSSRLVVGIYAFICIIHAVRARIEGIAAGRKHPSAVMIGQISYTLSLFIICAVMLAAGCCGWAIAVTAIFGGPISTTIAVYISLRFIGKKELSGK